MKKTVIALCLVALLALPACGAQSQGEPLVPEDVIAALVEAGAFSEELYPLEADMASQLHLLQPEAVVACTAIFSAGSTCEEAVAFTMASDTDAQMALTQLEAYLEGQIRANESYRPQEIPKLESALLLQDGDTVYLVVAEDMDVVAQVFEG